ncbi:uncharacterized protein BDW43DRAFT_241278 [Aspergillus alliaceus]|uniref:uncharacterized protein n=1 Tax=Petromyces alliaceus TaxID=209559 RepID=UPI0012A5602C|nr:uncharacterized protein BDW43DRAFT_241278 [Aspergillus alliaceus]KAB8236643.1 hypothetical protein BDW43DRAFT_241278 [Aspergillus alliaceus]
MALKRIFWLWLCLLLTAALANQASLISDSTCLASSNVSPKTSYDACCPSKSQSGTGYVDNIQFRYQCGLTPDPAGEEVPHKVGSIHDCATLCAENTDCKAGTWDYQYGRCYLTTNMSGTKPSPLWVLLEKSTKSDCQKVEAALRQCKMAEDTCQSARKECESNHAECLRQQVELQRQKDALTKENNDLTTKLDAAEKTNAQLQQERNTALTNYGTCQAQETQLRTAYATLQTQFQKTLPCPDGEELTMGGIRYKIYCGRGVSEAGFNGNHGGGVGDIGFHQCLSVCSADATCKGVNYWYYGDKPVCSMADIYENPPTGSGGYRCIGAVPVSPK